MLSDKVIPGLADRNAISPGRLIVEAVCRHFGVSTDYPMQKPVPGKKPSPVLVRQIIMKLQKENTNMSLREIGLPYGKDHSTVVSACKSIDNRIETYKSFAREWAEILGKCGIEE